MPSFAQTSRETPQLSPKPDERHGPREAAGREPQEQNFLGKYEEGIWTEGYLALSALILGRSELLSHTWQREFTCCYSRRTVNFH